MYRESFLYILCRGGGKHIISRFQDLGDIVTPVHEAMVTSRPRYFSVSNSQTTPNASQTPPIPSPKPFFYLFIPHSYQYIEREGKKIAIFPLVLANDRELKHDVLARQLLVHLAERIDLVIDARALFGIKEDFDNLMPVLLGADAFAHNLSGVDEVREDRVVDGGEGARSRALLGDTAATRGKWEDTALGDKQDVAVGEFLLELAGESNLKLLLAGWWVLGEGW